MGRAQELGRGFRVRVGFKAKTVGKTRAWGYEFFVEKWLGTGEDTVDLTFGQLCKFLVPASFPI